jgi:nucleoside-diphosphate-sugar epimerase
MDYNKNVLLVGGCGYLGGAITDYYLKNYKDKINLYVYDIILYEESYRKEVNFIYGDIRNTDCLLKIINDCKIDVVIWLAAIVGDDACNIDMLLTKEINVESLKRFSDKFNGKIIYLSSCSIYGIQKNDGLLTENDELNPVSLYGYTKLECENILKENNSIIFRMGTLFGISDTYSRIRFDLIINKLVLNAIRDNKLIIFGGNQYRPFLHVRDAAKIIFESIFINEQGVFNIAYKNEKIGNLIPIMRKYFESIQIDIHQMDFKDTRNYQVDCEKAKNKLKFDPILKIENGIEEMKKLLEEKRIKDLNNFRYSNFLYLTSDSRKLI